MIFQVKQNYYIFLFIYLFDYLIYNTVLKWYKDFLEINLRKKTDIRLLKIFPEIIFLAAEEYVDKEMKIIFFIFPKSIVMISEANDKNNNNNNRLGWLTIPFIENSEIKICNGLYFKEKNSLTINVCSFGLNEWTGMNRDDNFEIFVAITILDKSENSYEFELVVSRLFDYINSGKKILFSKLINCKTSNFHSNIEINLLNELKLTTIFFKLCFLQQGFTFCKTFQIRIHHANFIKMKIFSEKLF